MTSSANSMYQMYKIKTNNLCKNQNKLLVNRGYVKDKNS